MRFSVAAAVALSSVAGTLATTFDIKVGVNGTNFDPTSVTNVQKGDTLQFTFVAKNHSVVQSTFANPCTKKDNGINSDFHNISDLSSPFVWNLTVNDTNPLWFYCSQKIPADHCMSGMVFAVNAPENATYDAFKAKATSGTGTNTGAPGPNSTNTGGSGSGNNGAFSNFASTSTFSLLSVVGIAFGLVL